MWFRRRQVVVVELNPDKLIPILIGPGGAIGALLLFIGYLMRESSNAKKERDSYQKRYEDMREQRDEFRFIAGDAVRTGKRSAATSVALERQTRKEDSGNTEP